jgi:hypothetical protein
MAKDRSLVRASDIGAWTFCNRAWWLAHVQKAENENPEALARGTRAHKAHGRKVLRSDRLQRLGMLLIAAGLILAGLAILAWLFLF